MLTKCSFTITTENTNKKVFKSWFCNRIVVIIIKFKKLNFLSTIKESRGQKFIRNVSHSSEKLATSDLTLQKTFPGQGIPNLIH